MQGMWVRSLVQEDSTCYGTHKAMCHNSWACVAASTEACAPRAHALHQEKPLQEEALALQWRVVPTQRNQRKPAQRNEDPTKPKKKKFNDMHYMYFYYILYTIFLILNFNLSPV